MFETRAETQERGVWGAEPPRKFFHNLFFPTLRAWVLPWSFRTLGGAARGGPTEAPTLAPCQPYHRGCRGALRRGEGRAHGAQPPCI